MVRDGDRVYVRGPSAKATEVAAIFDAVSDMMARGFQRWWTRARRTEEMVTSNRRVSAERRWAALVRGVEDVALRRYARVVHTSIQRPRELTAEQTLAAAAAAQEREGRPLTSTERLVLAETAARTGGGGGGLNRVKKGRDRGGGVIRRTVTPRSRVPQVFQGHGGSSVDIGTVARVLVMESADPQDLRVLETRYEVMGIRPDLMERIVALNTRPVEEEYTFRTETPPSPTPAPPPAPPPPPGPATPSPSHGRSGSRSRHRNR